MAIQGVLTNEQFPCPPGNLPWSVADIKGPASYTQIVNGAAGVAPTGGQAVSKEALGLPVSVIWAKSMGAENGQYDVVCYMSPFNSLAGSQTGLILQWMTSATGAEVAGATDLSGHTLRILAIGR
jgi:hypothetical protein